MAPREPHPIRIIEDRWAVVSRIAQTLALLLAGAWGFYVFVYQERIKPAKAAPSLDISFRVERAGTLPNHATVIRAVLKFHNGGAVATDVYAEAESLYGVRYDDRSRRVDRNEGGMLIEDASLPERKRELLYSSVLLRDAARDGATGRHIALRPGDSFEEPLYLAVPPGKFQAVAGEAYIAGGRVKASHSVKVTRARSPRGGWQLISETGYSDFSDFLVL